MAWESVTELEKVGDSWLHLERYQAPLGCVFYDNLLQQRERWLESRSHERIWMGWMRFKDEQGHWVKPRWVDWGMTRRNVVRAIIRRDWVQLSKVKSRAGETFGEVTFDSSKVVKKPKSRAVCALRVIVWAHSAEISDALMGPHCVVRGCARAPVRRSKLCVHHHEWVMDDLRASG
jgi:hypothetical protein